MRSILLDKLVGRYFRLLRVREGGRLAVCVLIWLVHRLCSPGVSQDVSYWKFYLFAGSCFGQYSQFVSFSEM